MKDPGWKLPDDVAKEFKAGPKTPATFAHADFGHVDLRTVKLPQACKLAEAGIYLVKVSKTKTG